MLTMAALCLSAHAQSGQEKTTGETSTQPKVVMAENAGPNKQDSKVTVYVYRYKQFTGSALEPAVFVNGSEIAKMDNGRYFRVKLDPGKHTFQSNDKQSGIVLDLKSGEEYYIRVEIVAGVWKGHGRLVFVPEEQGTFEIQKLKPLDKKKVVDVSLVVTDELPAQTKAS